MTSSDYCKSGDDDIDLNREEGTRVGLPIEKFNVRRVEPVSLREDLTKLYDMTYDLSSLEAKKNSFATLAAKVNIVLRNHYDVVDPLQINEKKYKPGTYENQLKTEIAEENRAKNYSYQTSIFGDDKVIFSTLPTDHAFVGS